jgi:Putative zinc-finger
MKCWRIDLQRNLIYYLHKELDTKTIAKLENHLLDCSPCRAKLAQLHTSQAFLQHLEPVKLSASANSWNAIEAAITKQPTRQSTKFKPSNFTSKLNLKAALWFVGGMLLSSLLFNSFWLINKPPLNEQKNDKPEVISEDSSEGSFRLVSINEMPNNTEPHVVTEGYVSEIRIDPDGDTTFKIVEKLGSPQPFIVCEIIDSIKLPSPKIGTKVKVYGVSRYDEKANHKWYEVHPVLNIELVKN